MDTSWPEAIAAVAGALVAVSSVANNWMTWRLRKVADAHTTQIETVQTALDDHAAKVDAMTIAPGITRTRTP